MLTFLFTSPAMSAAFVKIGNDVTGISGVVIDGNTYDATFHNTFATADEFVYTEAFAKSATEALLDLFTGTGEFQGTEPDLVTDVFVGSELDFVANITTIYEVGGNGDVLAWTFTNKGHFINDPLNDPLDVIGQSNNFDPTFDSPSLAYTEWSQVSTVPVPATVWLMGSGLLGLIGYSRKNKG